MKEVAIAFFLAQVAFFAEAQVSISTHPRPLIVAVGTTFTLSCNYGGHTFISWEHPTLEVVTQSTGRVAVSDLREVSTATLEVHNAAMNTDQGQYTCTVRASNGQMVTRFVHATLYDPVQVTTADNQVFWSLEGDTATVSLPCSATNHNHIAWRRMGFSAELRNTSDGHLVILPDRLVINNVRFSDNGTYECTASNPVSDQSILSSLIVRVRAGVTASPVSSTVAEGSMVQFDFTVTGNPLPTVEWYKGTIGDAFRINLGQPQLESELSSDSSITSVYHLRFSSVRSEDTGTYICQARNQYGVPASAQITLQLSDALGPPQQVRATIVDQTNINVTWNRPDGTDTVDTYTVVWYSRSESPRSFVVMSSGIFHYVIREGLTRLTQYTVYVYALNNRGKGSDSQRVNITTDAVAPVAPAEVTVHDKGPTSVRLEWMFGDDGGAPITGIRVTFITLSQKTDFVEVNISSDQSSALISGLKDNHEYRFSVQARNRIGLGPPRLTDIFRTAPPGRPGSPSHVTGTWESGNQAALVCWEPSEVGLPFLSYTIEVLELKSNVTKIWKLRVDEVKENLPNCTAGYSVTGLTVGEHSCYKFKVVVSNSQGTGFPSAYSEEFCVPNSNNQGLQSSSGKPLLTTAYIVGIAVSLSVVLLVAVGVIFMWCICVRVRHSRSTAKFPTGPLPDRRSSERSNVALIDHTLETRFQHQMSIGSYTSSGSGNSVSGENTPNTAATTVSENPFTFDGVVNPRTQQSSFTQQQPQQQQPPDYPQSAPVARVYRSGSATLPAMNGSTLYPIPEHPPTPSHTLPYHATPPHYPYRSEHPPPSYPTYFPTPPSSVGPCLQETFEEDVEMTDNPLNDEFEKKMLAGGNPSRPNFSHEVDLPEDEPPPYVPPYRGDDMESEMSIPIGESCSQPPRSPQLSYQQQNNSRNNRTNHDRSNRDHNVMTPASFNISGSDNDDEDSEFIDNEAYQKVQESQFSGGGFGSQGNMLVPGHCSPVVTMEGGYGSQQRMIEDTTGSEGGSSKPRFKLGRNARRGEVFEEVKLRH